MRNLLVVLVIVIGGLLVSGAALAADGQGLYTTAEQANLATAQACFNAFTSGDMDSFFATLDDNVVWEVNGSPDFVPTHGKWEGIDAVRDWVGLVDSELEFLDFAADNYYVDGDTVIVVCHERNRVKATNKTIDEREVFLLTFTNGKIAHFLIFDDSAQEHWALQP